MTETTEVSRSHALRGNACLDAPRRYREIRGAK
jgi:hypothetical protein